MSSDDGATYPSAAVVGRDVATTSQTSWEFIENERRRVEREHVQELPREAVTDGERPAYLCALAMGEFRPVDGPGLPYDAALLVYADELARPVRQRETALVADEHATGGYRLPEWGEVPAVIGVDEDPVAGPQAELRRILEDAHGLDVPDPVADGAGETRQCDECGKPLSSEVVVIAGEVGEYCSVECHQDSEIDDYSVRPDGGEVVETADESTPTPQERLDAADGGLQLALAHLRAARDLESEREEIPEATADIQLRTVHLRALVDSPLTSWQDGAPAEFVDETLAETWEILDEYEELLEGTRYHLRSALQYLEIFRRCSVCGEPIVAELLVEAVGTGGPHALRGSTCASYHTGTDQWLVFVHGEGSR